ncbi:hypothetical protein OS035_10975 [Rhizobium sp. 268]|uniref:hypothetical protein n=1 Tax=Rhizobium TaxID=379 RepID=UPI00103906CE|nr:hypothetical protein [Rhizobium leguminosarum]TBY50067.1 hypothetical protein E0H54_05620 [Rhizobium leguminosarum bv. viciae]
MIISIEAMHLLPHPFEMQAPHPPPRVSAGTAALLLPAVVRFFSKACRTSSRGRLFRFWSKAPKTAARHPLSGDGGSFLFIPDFAGDFRDRRRLWLRAAETY